ncbi:MAG: non-homologous end-joining DNA ligase [Nitriliruptorales bacterium]
MAADGQPTWVEVEGRELRLSNLHKVLYPSAGLTKAAVVDYYARIAPVLLPHIAGRPMTLKRYPDGVDAEYFYEKNCPGHRPDWVVTARVPSGRSAGGYIDFCVVEDVPTLVWVANLASLELHPYLHRAPDLDRPTTVVFDLDPGEPAGLLEAAQVALDVRGLLDELDLESVVKTSGGKGIQVYLPLNSSVGYEDTGGFARALAQLLERGAPDRVVANMRKDLRAGKVLVDWSQNNAHKTTVGVYSLRARARPTVSSPLRWSEVEAAVEAGDASSLVFEYDDVLERVEASGDLFRPVLDTVQELPTLRS